MLLLQCATLKSYLGLNQLCLFTNMPTDEDEEERPQRTESESEPIA